MKTLVLAVILAVPELLSGYAVTIEANVGGDNYFAGLYHPAGGAVNQRNYFEFNLPAITGQIMAATLELEKGIWFSYYYPTPQQSTTIFTLYGPPSREAMNGDLGSLPVYGSWGVRDGSIPFKTAPGGFEQIALFSLNSTALLGLNSVGPGPFRIGGGLDNFAPGAEEDYIFDGAPRSFAPQLVLDVAEVPEPATLVLLFAVAGVAAIAARTRLERH